VRFDLAVRALAFRDVDLRRVVEPGRIAVMLGASSEDVRLEGSFEITGAVREIGGAAAFSTPAHVERRR
jgi:hypothetical protein